MTPSISICQLLLLYYWCWVLPGHGHNMYIFFSNYFFLLTTIVKMGSKGGVSVPTHISTYQEINKWIYNVKSFWVFKIRCKNTNKTFVTVQYLAGLEIKPVRTVLKSSGIHRLLVSFRANLMTYNFQTFFLPQYIKLCKVFMSILFNFWKSYFI